MGDRWDRERWRTAAERLLATDMGVDERCALNHVSPSALYRRLAWFRDNEPEVLGGREAAHAGDGEGRWLEAVRAAARGAALPSAPHAAPGFVEVGLPGPAPGPLLGVSARRPRPRRAPEGLRGRRPAHMRPDLRGPVATHCRSPGWGSVATSGFRSSGSPATVARKSPQRAR